MNIKPEIVTLIHNDTIMNQCHTLARASGCDYTEMLELMVEALCAWKAKTLTEEILRLKHARPADVVLGDLSANDPK
jgi:hypothetical protein